MWIQSNDTVLANGCWGGSILGSSGNWLSNANGCSQGVFSNDPDPSCGMASRLANQRLSLTFASGVVPPGGHAEGINGQFYRPGWATPFDSACDDYSKLPVGAYANDIHFALFENGEMVCEFISPTQQDGSTGQDPCGGADGCSGGVPTATPVPSDTPLPSNTPTPLPGSADVRLEHKSTNATAITNDPRYHLRLYNQASENLSLEDVEIRYWYEADGASSQQLWTDWAARVGGQTTAITNEVVESVQSTSLGGQSHYLRQTFQAAAGALGQNQYVEIQIRFNQSNWANYDQSNDYSFRTDGVYSPWTKVTVYVNGSTVWGEEPGAGTAVFASLETTRRKLPGNRDLIAVPNPAKDQVLVLYRLEQASAARLVLTTLAGEMVISKSLGERPSGENTAALDFQNLATGIYYLFLQVDSGYGYVSRANFKLAIVK